MKSSPNMSGVSSQKIIGFLVLAAFGVLLWVLFSSETPLQTSTLRTSFNRLSSIPVEFEIPQAGRLRINAGPSSILADARVFGLTISSAQATPTNADPFLVSSAFETFFNLKSPQDPRELQLGIVFPEGQFTREEGTIAEVPFSTTQAGEFVVKTIYFGSTSSTVFPPYQDYPVFIESSTIAFDENGAARIVTTTTTPPPSPKPLCSDTLDNDNDQKIDFPQDPGCTDVNDTDETDPPGPKPLRLDIPSQHLKTIQTIDYRTETIVILPPAQEQLFYQFTLKASGGSGQYTFGVRGRPANINQAYALDGGFTFKNNGLLTGDPASLRAANYLYPLFVTDGDQTLNFSLQIAVHDTLGNPVGLIIETSFSGTEHRCVVDQPCEAFFKATKGIEPYLYSFSGEAPITTAFLQVNAGQAFYRFTPTAGQIGVYNGAVTVTDSSKPPGKEVIGAKSTVPFTLTIDPPAIESSFKFSAEPTCEFLDLSLADESYEYFQFTCRNGVMQGSQGLVRAEDSLNRAEAAKITTLIVSEEEVVADTFEPFDGLPAATPVNYNDVSVGDWYSTFVYYLFKEGIIVDNLLYRPADTLNAAEAMKLVVESYAPLNDDLAIDLLDITDFDEWFEPYQTIASYVDASIAYVDPALPAKREWIAELLYKIYRSYPVQKFQ